MELLPLYIAKGIIDKGTLVCQLVEDGISPLETILTQMLFTRGQAITYGAWSGGFYSLCH